MNAPTPSSAASEKSPSSAGEAEISRSAEQKIPRSPTQIEADAEQIMSSVARFNFKFDQRTRRAIVRTPATASIP